jgi:EpsI family protein
MAATVRIGLAGILMVAAVLAAEVLEPRSYLSENLPKIDLERQIPRQFGEWTVDRSIVPVMPNPEVLAKVADAYDQYVARTYVNAAGQRVMLTVAYGRNQSADSTSVHRPEFCYAGQGFAIENQADDLLTIEGRRLAVRRLVGQLYTRREPITYWVTMGERATLPGLDRKLLQFRYGLKGQIADGMLVRVSSIGPNLPGQFSLHDGFVRDLLNAIDSRIVDRYAGSSTRPS